MIVCYINDKQLIFDNRLPIINTQQLIVNTIIMIIIIPYQYHANPLLLLYQ